MRSRCCGTATAARKSTIAVSPARRCSRARARSSRCCSISCSTRRRRWTAPATSLSTQRAVAMASSSRCATPGRESRPKISRACSSPSSPPSDPAKAPASASPSATRSRTSSAAASAPRTPLKAARCSRSFCLSTVTSARVLVIDDDPGLAEVLELLLSREGYGAERAATMKQGLERAAARDVDLVITDLRLPDGTGLDVIRELRARQPALPIIMVTSYSSMESAIAALRGGAVDYLIKPFENDELVHSVARALAERRMSRENAILKRNLRSAYGARPIIGESAGIKRVLELVRKSAPSEANVLISGESGSGKELVALALHYSSPRAEGPLVSVSCSALPRAELEAELFGREGAAEGRMREADGGTLFLDEVGELAPAMQVKLLHALEEKAVRPVGGKRSYPVDVRVIAATQRELAPAIERGQFRSDLHYRLSVISIQVPPLRDRGGDALVLARHFAEHYARKLGKAVPRFDAEFAAFVQNYPWPGNVRELENMIERAVILAESDELSGRDLAEVAPALPMLRAATPLPGDARPLAIEEYIREVIERFQDSHSETELARMLGIGRKALWMRRRQWGLKRTRKDVSR